MAASIWLHAPPWGSGSTSELGREELPGWSRGIQKWEELKQLCNGGCGICAEAERGALIRICGC